MAEMNLNVAIKRFTFIDANNDTMITADEFQAYSTYMNDGKQATLLEKDELVKEFTELDKNGDGKVVPEEFDEELTSDEVVKAAALGHLQHR